MESETNEIDTRQLRRRFERAAARFNDADFVHRRSFDALMERLEPLRIAPELIVDLGAATGTGSRRLAAKYSKARILSVDFSGGMLRQARTAKPFFSRIREVEADARRLPLPADSVDLVVANMLLPFISDLPACLLEISRVLTKGGVFAFATLGPDSFGALREAWRSVDGDVHVCRFPDMHDVGDALVRAGLADPVLDVDYLTVTYPDSGRLFRDLAAAGARNALRLRPARLTGKHRFARMLSALGHDRERDEIAIKLELVFGHAFGSGPRPPAGEYRVAPDRIGRRGRRG